MRVGAPFNPYRVFQGAFAPFWLIEHRGLSAGAKLCYIRLLGFAGRDGRCYPSLETLGGSLGVSERQARDYVKELERTGLIAIEQRGLRKTNVYLFIWTAELKRLVDSVPPSSPDPESHEGPESNMPPDRNDSSGQNRNSTSSLDRNDCSAQDRKRASGPIGINSVEISSTESSSSAARDPIALATRRKDSAWRQVSRSTPSVANGDSATCTASVIVEWAKERSLRRLRSDGVAGFPEQDLLSQWAEILDGLGVTEAERITDVLDCARAAADRSRGWRSWSFLTLQIQLAAERTHSSQAVASTLCTEGFSQVTEDPGCEWVEAKARIRALIGEIAFANWFEPSRQTERDGTALTIAVPDEATRDFIDIDYREVVTKAISGMGVEIVHFIVRDRSRTSHDGTVTSSVSG